MIPESCHRDPASDRRGPPPGFSQKEIHDDFFGYLEEAHPEPDEKSESATKESLPLPHFFTL